ncbi:hypothetical protein M4L90_02680 [Staphylococcus equorum]|uniref:Uncharacterized protein n=1 Tax=Staphylococcus equorum TaxID=246432 RepID=A0A9X4L6S1_9STAP|nr:MULTISPECIES: hypothetical protein [Staphylococcus]MDG0818794.1 hypothetical protein [Staphylococcus equorum]MDG0839435.1 hypothetical protein [Staphylococcus equorum]MDG0844839.1 hypothetical protein [Staphylococcus equorum]
MNLDEFSLYFSIFALVVSILTTAKDTKINALEYKVAYLLFTIFEDDLPKRELSDEDLRKIKDEFNKRMK